MLGSDLRVGMARFELATSSSRTKRATGLRYIPQKSVGLSVQVKCGCEIGSAKIVFLLNIISLLLINRVNLREPLPARLNFLPFLKRRLDFNKHCCRKSRSSLPITTKKVGQ